MLAESHSGPLFTWIPSNDISILGQDKTRQCFIWSLIQSYVYRLWDKFGQRGGGASYLLKATEPGTTETQQLSQVK